MTDHGKRHGTGATLSLVHDGSGPGDGDGLWIGEHAVDHDILVFDPSESDASASVLSFYSLTQHRSRSFGRSTIGKSIREVTDDIRSARARKDYARRDELLAVLETEQESERVARGERQREMVLEHHRKYLDGVGVEYQGVHDEPQTRKRARRSICHACKITLDDFAGVVCGVCDGVLCSCGACGCGSPARKR